MPVKNPELEKIFKQLVSIESYSGFSNNKALQHLANLINISFDLTKLEGLEKAIELAYELLKNPLETGQKAFLHYCLVNAWHDKRKIIKL